MHVSAGVHMAMCVGGGQEGEYLGVILSFYSSIWGLTAGTFTCWATSCPVLWFWYTFPWWLMKLRSFCMFLAPWLSCEMLAFPLGYRVNICTALLHSRQYSVEVAPSSRWAVEGKWGRDKEFCYHVTEYLTLPPGQLGQLFLADYEHQLALALCQTQAVWTLLSYSIADMYTVSTSTITFCFYNIDSSGGNASWKVLFGVIICHVT